MFVTDLRAGEIDRAAMVHIFLLLAVYLCKEVKQSSAQLLLQRRTVAELSGIWHVLLRVQPLPDRKPKWF